MFKITVNTPPTAAFTGPANLASFPAGSTVNLTVSAADPDGSVSLVEYFRGSTKIGESTTPPFSFAWTNC